jgi:hypothetical protein
MRHASLWANKLVFKNPEIRDEQISKGKYLGGLGARGQVDSPGLERCGSRSFPIRRLAH